MTTIDGSDLEPNPDDQRTGWFLKLLAWLLGLIAVVGTAVPVTGEAARFLSPGWAVVTGIVCGFGAGAVIVIVVFAAFRALGWITPPENSAVRAGE